MIKKYKDYIILLSIFLLCLFSSNINYILKCLNPNLDTSKISSNYNTYLKSELDNLRNIHNLKINDKLDLEITRVKYRNIYSYMNTLTIFKGTNDNLSVGDAVLTNNALVGVISKTYKNHSLVLLLNNKDLKIAVKVGEVQGTLKVKDNILKIVDIIGNVEEGDLVYTSEFSNLPANIYIGKVVSVNNDLLEKEAYIELGENLDKLDYLFVWRNND